MSFLSTRIHNLTYTSRFYNGGVREKDLPGASYLFPWKFNWNFTGQIRIAYEWMKDYVMVCGGVRLNRSARVITTEEL